MTDPAQLTVDEHLAKAVRFADLSVEHGLHGFGDSALAWATVAQVHVSLAQILTAREALAAHDPVGAEPVPGAALTRIHEALADDARPP